MSAPLGSRAEDATTVTDESTVVVGAAADVVSERRQKRVYVCGPMTGLPGLNFPSFHAAAAVLRAAGHHVENPAEINADPAAAWADCMREDIARLVTCDAICVLPGWERSRGAALEMRIAAALGMAQMVAA